MTNTISATEEAAPATPAAGSPAADDTESLRAELESLRGERDELRRSNEFWADQARSAQSSRPAPAVEREREPEAEVEDNTDLMDLIATGGAKAFDQYMRGKGFITRAEAEQMANSAANSKAAQLTTEQELMSAYPELKNRSSEFFNATARHYGELIKQGVPETAAMRLAAEKAELEGIKAGKVKTPQQRTDDDKAAREAQRQARIKAQSGERNTRTPVEAEPEDDTLTDHEKYICRAMGISEEAYAKRAKAGVQMGGLPKGR